MKDMFSYAHPQVSHIGPGAVHLLAEETARLGDQPLIVTYAPPVSQGFIKPVLEVLSQAGLAGEVYDAIQAEPDTVVINQGHRLALQKGCNCVVAVGGGSVIDAAKAIAILYNNPGTVEEYQMGIRQITRRGLPVLAVPTTAGTGSECTKASVIHNREEGIKKSLIHPYLVPNVAILDPVLTVDLPPRLTAGTGIDALSHALETFVSSGARPLTEMWSVCALELIGKHFIRAVHDGKDLSVREGMLVASYLAGLALNAGVGTAHILAQPISAVHGLSHSDAISLVLRATVERNLDYASERYARAAQALGENGGDILKAIDHVYCETQVGSKLADYGLTHLHVDDILDRVRRSTSHLKTNPRPVDETLLEDILNNLIQRR